MIVPPCNLSTHLCLLRVEAWEEPNIWTTTAILAWYPQKIVAEHKLPPVLTWGWGTPGNNLRETCFEILHEKCRENFAKIFGDLTPIFTQPKWRNFSHEIPLSFPQGFPHGFRRCFRAWETKGSPQPRHIQINIRQTKGWCPSKPLSLTGHVAKTRMADGSLSGFIKSMRSSHSALFNSKST